MESDDCRALFRSVYVPSSIPLDCRDHETILSSGADDKTELSRLPSQTTLVTFSGDHVLDVKIESLFHVPQTLKMMAFGWPVGLRR